jgi:putative membrane protein
MHAAAGSSKEIELGKMAQQKAQNRIVKDFGARMIKDHTQANAELKQLAEKKKIPMPLPGSMTDNSNKEMLMTRSGAEFDKEYMRMMVDDHQKTIALFENASSNLSDPNIKAFASKTLPILREHFDMARTIAERVGANATSGQ